MFCKNCGREISDNAVVCPHCGVQVSSMRQQQTSEGENTIAVVGFVFSFLIALVGLICSVIGYRKAVNEGAPNKGLAMAGIIISAVSIGLSVLIFIICIATCSAAAASLPYYY